MKLIRFKILLIVIVLILISSVGAFEIQNESNLITGAFVNDITGAFVDAITGSLVETPKASFQVSNFGPVITYANFTGTGGDLINISLNVSDPNGDSFNITYGSPLNSSGQWQSNLSHTGTYTAEVSATDGTSTTSVTVYIFFGAYCGDNVCNGDESCATCTADCGTCPASTTPATGGGGGGGSSSADRLRIQELEAEILRLSNKTRIVDNFEAQVQEIFIEIQEEEFQGEKIKVNNYLNESFILTVGVEGEIEDSIILDTQFLRIEAQSEKTLDIMVLGNKPVGTYVGILTLESSTNIQLIPITLKIIPRLAKPELETLDIDIDLLTDEVSPGDWLKFKLGLRKTPLVIREPQDVKLKYLILRLDPKNVGYITGAVIADLQNLTSSEELIYEEDFTSIEDVVSLPKEIEIPKDFVTGEYILSINAEFKGKTIPLFTKFQVQFPWYLQKVYGIPKGGIVIAAIVIVMIWMLFLISKVKEHGTKAFRYEIKLDKAALPKSGPKSAEIGKIAERNKNTYLDLNDLKTHTLVSGTTGCGKTIAAQVLVEEALKKDVSVVIFDPTAQWTGFLRKCEEKDMLNRYSRFGMKESEAQGFAGKVHEIQNPNKIVDIKKLMDDKMNIFLLNKLNSKQLNKFISKSIKSVFQSHPKEYKQLRLLLVLDEVHRLLPKFGGSKQAYTAIEKAVREFRKWGIGVLLVSQVTEDLVGPIEANISTQIQMKTNDQVDLNRIQQKFGDQFLKTVVKAPTGVGLLANSSYNHGKPYFVVFRPILHRVKGLDKKELVEYLKFSKIMGDIKDKIERLKNKKVNVFDLKIELDLAEKQINLGKFDIAKIYLDTLVPKVNKKFKSGKKSKSVKGKK